MCCCSSASSQPVRPRHLPDSLMINVGSGEKKTSGVQAAGATGAGNVANLGNPTELADARNNTDRAMIMSFTLLGETIGEFRNEKPVPGVTFSWGPDKSGTI